MILSHLLVLPLPTFMSLICLWMAVREIDDTPEHDFISMRQNYQIAWFDLIMVIVFTGTTIWNLPGLLQAIQISSI